MANRTYRYFKGEPLFPFGYGLSYTEFRYGKARVSDASITAEGTESVSVEVTNKGAVDSDEVVQLYLSHEGVAGAALRELHGFQRIHLAIGQTRAVTFTLRDRELSVVDSDGNRRIVSGKVKVWVGGGQPGGISGRIASAGAGTEFNITSERTLPD